MGNNSSSASSEHQARFFRSENLSNDPSAFRVFVKKKNKFIPGWLKINDDEIVFTRGGNNFQYWSLAHLRRYGYTCSGVFFFESGRRCATGEGLHTFQSHQAERIFHMVQSKIKIEEYARGSRAGSVASGRVNSLVPTPSAASSRIHPVQRFSSEGANNEFPTPNGSLAPPPYGAFQDARRAQMNASPNCPSVISSVSGYASRGTAAPTFRDRPRSVVSNLEHNVVVSPLAQQQQQQMLQQHGAAGQLRHHHPLQTNSSSATLLQHILNQQHQGYALPPHMNALAGSSSGSCLMNQSFHSALDSGSPWASQQQLEGDIVMEHVLGDDVRRRGGGAGGGGRQPPAPAFANNNSNSHRADQQQHNQQQQPPIRVAVPPPRPPYGQQNGSVLKGRGGEQQQQPHAYVNVNLPGNAAGGGGNAGLNVRELHRTDRSRLEFLSTGPGAFQISYSPSGPSTPVPMPTAAGYYSPSPSAFGPPSMHQQQHHPFLQHQQHLQHLQQQHYYGALSPFTPPYQQQQQQQMPNFQQQYSTQQHQMLASGGGGATNMMSQSLSGALPPYNCSTGGRHTNFAGANDPATTSNMLFASSSMEHLMVPNGASGMLQQHQQLQRQQSPLNYALIETTAATGDNPMDINIDNSTSMMMRHGQQQQQTANNIGSNSTLLTSAQSSTNTMSAAGN